MKIIVNKSAKRVLSIALALVMLVGTLFTANIGANITADAATDPTATKTVVYWDGSNGTFPTKGTGTAADPYIIETPAQLHYVAVQAGHTNTNAKHFKVADNMIFVLQPSTVITDLDAYKAMSATEVRDFLRSASGKKNWINAQYPGVFNGNFDGNGVEIYGLYADGTKVYNTSGAALSAGSDAAALFPNIDGGGTAGAGTSSAYITDDVGSTFKHFTVMGSYIIGIRRVGVVTGTTQWAKGGCYVDGLVNLDKLVVANNYVEGIGTTYTAADGTTVTQSRSSGEMGVLVGASGNDPTTATNCLIYGNVSAFKANETDADDTAATFCLMAGNGSCARSNTTGVTVYGGLKNSLVLGTTICGSCTNSNVTAGVYADMRASSEYRATTVVDGDTLKGEMGRASLGAFDWADQAEDINDGKTYWFARENDYPTPIQPADDYWKTVDVISIWSGAAAGNFAGGTGTKEDPYIIKSAEQLYLALTQITDTTNSVAGGVQTSQILKQGSTTEYVPVYTPYYYKVDDSVKKIYLNNILGSETLAGIKEFAAGSTKQDWKPGKSFVGYLDGNGVTIYGMYSSSGQGLVYKLDGSATVKNFNFDSCYSSGTGNAALLTTNLGSYANDSTIINVANISVRNSYIATTRAITLTQRTDNSLYQYNPGAAGIVSTTSTAESFTMSNCLYDGHTCERAIGSGSEATVDMIGAIISGGYSMNNVVLNSCVSLGAPAVDEVYVSGKEIFYNRYDKNQGFPVHFYGCYSDMPLNEITTAYTDKYDKLKDIERIDEADAYEMFDMPKLSWSNWALTELDDGRTIPMPTVNAADEIVGSYVSIIGSEAKSGKYASVGPYPGGTNPYTYTLKGSGTEADPFIIETDVQLARAIATGGMNLYDKLYYKLGNDIDISGGAWITQDTVTTSSASYTYTPFKGTLDGDGYTITGLSAGDSASAGLIPVLDGGTVKNLHLRDVTVVSGTSAGAIVGEIYDNNWEDEIYPTIENCSVEGATISAADGYYGGYYFVGYDDVDDDTACNIKSSYFIGTNGTVYVTDNYTQASADEIKNEIVANNTDYTSKWYIGGKEGSMPRLKAMAEKMDCADVDGDGIGSEYTANDLTSLRNNLLKKSAYKYIFGDVSRNGTTNIADLAALQRTLAEDYGSIITDSFFANVSAGNIKVYYGENDNYDAARKVELYLEELTGADVDKVVVDDNVVWGSNSNADATYVHQNDFCLIGEYLYYPIGDSYGEITNSDEKAKYALDGELEIIVGNIDNYSAYATNTVATADNTYAVTYDADKKVVWLQGANFTAVEQAAINFTSGCNVQGDVVYTCASTELEDHKKPIIVKLDTNYDGTIDTDKTLYYAWGDEFEGDTIDTNNWTHNSQQGEWSQGKNSVYWNQEIAPVKDLNKVITVTNGRLSMKRGYDSKLGTSTNGTVALDVTAGEENGYTQWVDGINGDNAIDADGSDVYFSSGKIITDRGMLYKQGYIEFQGQLPADGHAFPAWWLMGRPSQAANNNGYDNSLYSKVYKLNENWNGSATWDQTNLDTYKYQIPSAIYEIDMIEVMQHPSRYGTKFESTGIFGDGSGSYNDDTTTKNWTKAVGWYMINSTVHKWWNNGVYNGGTSDDTSDDLLYIHDWDNYQVLGGITNDAFSTTSTAGSWIHNIGSTQLDFGTSVSENDSWFTGYKYYDGSIVESARDDLQATRKYGFSWNTDGVSGFEATLYVYNTDGTLKTTVPIASGMSSLNAFLDKNGDTEAEGAIGSNAGVYSDAKVFNQYMYILFDNKFYSSNNLSGNAIQFTDLLTAAGLTSLEIDYVRVYQEDGARDIVTKETESFNNANHFGY